MLFINNHKINELLFNNHRQQRGSIRHFLKKESMNVNGHFMKELVILKNLWKGII